MVEKDIIEKILRGEDVHIIVKNHKTSDLEDFKAWIRQFGRLCGGSPRLNCNLFTPFRGDTYLDVYIGDIPIGQSQLLAGKLSQFDTNPTYQITEQL